MRECIKQRQKCLGVQQQLPKQPSIKYEVDTSITTSVVVLTNDKDKDMTVDLTNASTGGVIDDDNKNNINNNKLTNNGAKNMHWQRNKLTASSLSSSLLYWKIKCTTIEQSCTAMLCLMHNRKPQKQQEQEQQHQLRFPPLLQYNEKLTPMDRKQSYSSLESTKCNVTHFLLLSHCCLICRRKQRAFLKHGNCSIKCCSNNEKTQQQQQMKSISLETSTTTSLIAPEATTTTNNTTINTNTENTKTRREREREHEHGMNRRDAGNLHARRRKIIMCNCCYCCFSSRVPHRRMKNKSSLLILQIAESTSGVSGSVGGFINDGWGGGHGGDGKHDGAIRKIQIMTSHAAQCEENQVCSYKKAAPICLLGITIAVASAKYTNYNYCLYLLRHRKSLNIKTNRIALMRISKEIDKLMNNHSSNNNQCTKYHPIYNFHHNYHQHHHYNICATIPNNHNKSSRRKCYKILSSHVLHSNTPQRKHKKLPITTKTIETTTHSLNIFNAENHQHKSLLSASTLATCNRNNNNNTAADNSFSNKCNNNNNNNNKNVTCLICCKPEPKQAAGRKANVDEDEEKTTNKENEEEKEKHFLSVNIIKKKNWKVEAFFQPLCSFILFIEKQTRKERNVLTNIFYTQTKLTTTKTTAEATTATTIIPTTAPIRNIISKCNNQNIFNSNSNITLNNNNNNKNKNSGQPSPEMQRLISQRDDDTSKYYNNRENCRFFKHSNNNQPQNNFNINNKQKQLQQNNKPNLNSNDNCNNSKNIKINSYINIQQTQQQQQLQQQHINNNNEQQIYKNVKDVDIKNTNYLSQFQQQQQQQQQQKPTELQTIVNQQKRHYSSKILDADEFFSNNTIAKQKQRKIPQQQQSSSSYGRQQKLCAPHKLRIFLMNYNDTTTTYLKYFYILLTLVCLTTTRTSVALAAATANAESFSNTFVNSLNTIGTNITTATTTTNTKPSVTLANNEIVCRSLDLRNEPSDFRQLENCTVIEGFLLISLVNTHAQTEFNETYPLLTEVSEFIIVYRVNHLRSLAQIFPNLSIIRGRVLFEGYALAIYNNPQLEELGLSKLITISRGAVRIEENYALCFVHTVQWEAITNSTENVIRKNRPPLECPLCPGDHKGLDVVTDNEFACKKNAKTGKRHCWNSNNCQKVCPAECHDNCIDENTCCNEACIGGCLATNPNICISCRNFSIDNSTCIDECPPTYFNYVDRRCITAENCAGIGTKYENNKPETLIAYDGNCTTHCPAGYAKVNATCEECGDKCTKMCEGGLIDSVSHAKDMNGCTHIIKEGLVISIKRGGRFLMEDLEYGLSSIKVIDTYLKVHLTYGMFSLEFFKSLETIKGELLYENRFSLYVLENSDLEHIWAPNQNVRLENGRVFFHFNPKLCVSEIQKLLPMMRLNTSFESSEVATDSNGSKGSCNTDVLNTTVIGLTSQTVTIQITNPLKFDDERTFIGYIYYYIEDQFGNATKHGYRPCEDGWTSSDPTKETTNLFAGLAPFTTYAYYVKTMTISMEPRNAQSNIGHFKTKSSTPQPVSFMNAYANSSSEIVLNWSPPYKVHGKLKKYRVKAVMSPMMQSQQIDTVNYCKTPLPNAQELGREFGSNVKQTTENPENSENCRCAPGEKTGSKHRSDETDTPIISESMSFENAVQNFVYVKHTNATSTKSSSDETKSSRRRRRRQIAMETEKMDSYLLRHVRSLSNHTEESGPYTSMNESKLDDTENYYEIVVDFVDENTTQYVFSKLKHFTTYHLSVEACREPEVNDTKNECSAEKEKQMRTLKLDDVDIVRDLNAELESTNTTRSLVRLRWKPPINPNGLVVSYTISYQLLAEDAVEEKRCITEQDYRKLVDGYPLVNLPIGNHSIRVRSNTQAGEGIYSDPVYVDIPPTRISNAIIAAIVITIVSFLAIIGGFLYYLRKKLLTTPSDLKMFPSVNPYYISLQYIPDDWEVSRERVIQLSPLGQGSFGMVYEGILKGLNDDDEDQSCAVKTVNENATDRERMNFLNEASVMKQFDTYHVVRLLGVCSRGQPALVIMELMKNGDLKSYLRAHRPDEREDGINGYMLPQHEQLATSVGGGGTLFQPPPLSRLYQMAIEIADGMAYLSAKKFVHRDLAARNCMVAADLTVKIGDFGMTRDIYETDYYRKGTKGLLPVRWMPPESLRDGVYSSASDVFSYGVVLWEMATLASQPYQGLSNDQVLRYVIDGGVMERPENCPDKLYRLMQRCWHHRPSARPSFMDIITHLSDLAHETFRQVSFYYSEEGEQIRQKELADKMQHSDDVFTDREIEMDDVTTPLRVGEYNDYKMNMENNSSIENHDGSPMGMEDEPQHSAYSLGSDINASSTPEGNLHGGGLNLQNYTPKILPVHEGYVQSYGVKGHSTNPIDIVIQKSVENEERGYEVYDPSPQYHQHHHHLDGHDDDDEGGVGGDYGSSSVDARMLGERLLPRKKRNQRGRSGIIIKQISNSVPEEVGGITISSSLHPSTASAASSNASSTATATGKYPSLKKTVADTMQNVGFNLRNINKRLFSHKRAGSTGSHKSINLQPTIEAGTHVSPSIPMVDNIGTQHQQQPQQQLQQQQHLATIESGGSGSAGSYCMSPRFFTPAAAGASDNPNYQPYDVAKSSTQPHQDANVNYQLMGAQITSKTDDMEASENPNYELMQPQLLNELLDIKNVHISENPNYQVTGPPDPKEPTERESFLTVSKTTSSSASLSSSETEMSITKKSGGSKKQRNRKNRSKQNQGQRPNQQQLVRDESNIQPLITESTPLTQITVAPITTIPPLPTTTTTATTDAPQQPQMSLSRFSLKEKWLRQQQQQQQQPSQQSHLSSPPNGFIG